MLPASGVLTGLLFAPLPRRVGERLPSSLLADAMQWAFRAVFGLIRWTVGPEWLFGLFVRRR